MAHIVAIHAFRRGAGKSSIAANVAVLLAAAGQRVALLDSDLPTPSLHYLFGLGDDPQRRSFNDYLWARCPIEEAICDLSDSLALPPHGRLFLIPASAQVSEVTMVLRGGLPLERIGNAFRQLVTRLELDILLVDTHAGLTEETLQAIAFSDALFIVLRHDQRDYQGVSVTVEVARQLDVPHVALIANEVPTLFDVAEVRARLEETFGCPVAGILPHADVLAALAGTGLMVQHAPHHPLTSLLRHVAAAVASSYEPRGQ